MVEGATKGDHFGAPELVYRAKVEEWEEPLHPGSLCANIPHFLPQCNPICTSPPTFPSRRRRSRQNARCPLAFPSAHASPSKALHGASPPAPAHGERAIADRQPLAPGHALRIRSLFPPALTGPEKGSNPCPQ